MDQLGPAIFALVFILAGILLAFGVVHAHRRMMQRRAALAALAAELGLAFHHHNDRTHDDLYAHFEIFRRGDNRTAYNTLSGTLTLAGRPMPAKLGDFTYEVTSGSGKDRRTTTYRFSYLIVHLPDPVPDLLIRPENLFDRIRGVFSDHDIDFESEEFSRRYFVASPDRRFAYGICHPRMMEYLLATRPPAVDIEHARLCLADGARTWEPDQFRATLAWLDGFLARWPAHAVETATGRTASA